MKQKVMVNKSHFSLTSLKIDLYFNDNLLSTATGFIILVNDIYYLVTNYHVLSGKNFNTNKALSITSGLPNKMSIWCHLKGKPGYYKKIDQKLYDNNDDELFINGKK